MDQNNPKAGLGLISAPLYQPIPAAMTSGQTPFIAKTSNRMSEAAVCKKEL